MKLKKDGYNPCLVFVTSILECVVGVSVKKLFSETVQGNLLDFDLLLSDDYGIIK